MSDLLLSCVGGLYSIRRVPEDLVGPKLVVWSVGLPDY